MARRTGSVCAKLTVERLELAEANAFVAEHHRHHKPVIGHLFSIGASFSGRIVGVAIVGRPVSRFRDDGVTAEVTRLCTDGTKNACSFLYGASVRAAFALGFKRIGTYILASEPGTSLTAANWRMIGETCAKDCGRPRHPGQSYCKQCHAEYMRRYRATSVNLTPKALRKIGLRRFPTIGA